MNMKQSDINQPELIMLVGIPGVGKSTWIRAHMAKYPEKDYVVVSSDDIIEELGAAAGLATYSEAFDRFIGQATGMMKERARQAFADRRNVIWDQTNLTPKLRRGKLRQAHGYRKVAVVWSLMDSEWKHRFNQRKAAVGKDIPAEVLSNMQQQFVMPTKDEGFEKITVIRG